VAAHQAAARALGRKPLFTRALWKTPNQHADDA
jgi:hypothetical protein